MGDSGIITIIASFLAQFIVGAFVYYQKIAPKQNSLEQSNADIIARFEEALRDNKRKDDAIEKLREENAEKQEQIIQSMRTESADKTRLADLMSRQNSLETRYTDQMAELNKLNGAMQARLDQLSKDFSRQKKLAENYAEEVNRERADKVRLEEQIRQMLAGRNADDTVARRIEKHDSNMLQKLDTLIGAVTDLREAILKPPSKS